MEASYTHFQMLLCCARWSSFLPTPLTSCERLSRGMGQRPLSHQHCQVLCSSPGRLFVETGTKIRVRSHILGPNIAHTLGFGNQMYKLLTKTIPNTKHHSLPIKNIYIQDLENNHFHTPGTVKIYILIKLQHLHFNTT